MTARQAARQGSIGSRRRALGASVVGVGFVTLLLLGFVSALLTWSALEIQTGAANFVTAEGYWSKGRSETVQALYAYATTGEAPELRRARDALAIPLAGRAARIALEASPPDLAAARAGLLAGGNDPQDVNRMIRFYLLFRNAGPMEAPIATWRQADESILRLVEIGDELEVAHAGPPDPNRLGELRRELAVVNATLRPLELAFSRGLADGVRRLRTALLAATAAGFLLMALVASGALGWAQRRVRLSERNLRATFQQAAVGMARLGPDGRIVDMNEAFARVLGRPRSDLLSLPLIDLMHEDDAPPAGEPIAATDMGLGGSGAIERRFVRGDGSTLWTRMTVSHVELDPGGERHAFVIVEDVSEARRLSAELDYRARHDMLTGLINRFEIERRLEMAVASGTRHGEPHALCMLDLDQFKVVNDTAGHAAGDHLLREVAELLTRSLRTNDTVGRLGGDEFAIILDHAGFDEARRVTAQIRQAIADHVFEWDERSFDVTCSIGFVEIGGDEADVGSLLRKADIACYLAKERGRDRVHAYVEGDEALVHRQGQMEWVGRVRRAVAEGRLKLRAQRIVSVQDDSAQRYELLLRLVDEEGREHGPEAFMPAAERFGLSGSLDRWVVREALSTLARHPEHVERLTRCHVNLSAHSLSDEEFRTFLEAALDASGVPCEKLCFEITETAVVRSLTEARTLIASLRGRGCHVALDDFGTGLSSFGHLRSLSVDLVKVDGVFVRDVAVDELDRTIVRSVHDVARVLGKRTVAEFVESDAAREVLREIGIDLMQGMAIHAPVPWEALLEETSGADGGRGSTGA